MNNEAALNRIYNNLEKLIDTYTDLPETKEAEKEFWKYAKKNILQSNRNVEERELESVLFEVEEFREKQGFMYGFNYALELTGRFDMLNTSIKGIEDELSKHDS